MNLNKFYLISMTILMSIFLPSVFASGTEVSEKEDHDHKDNDDHGSHNHTVKKSESSSDVHAKDSHNHEKETSKKTHAHDEKAPGDHDADDQKKEDHDHDHHEEDEHEHGSHGSPAFGKDKAISSVEDDGEIFELNEKAIKALKIETTEIKSQGKGSFKLPKNSLVSFQEKYGVYVKRGKNFQLLEVSQMKRQAEYILVELNKAGEAENIVTSGVALLRVAHLQASGQGGQGHVH